jgi:hypothetical protein
LVVEYFADKSFTNRLVRRYDPTLDFQWGGGPAVEGQPEDWFTVRWTGFLLAPQEGDYEFQVLSDDGIRVQIDDNPVFDALEPHVQRGKAAMKLTRGAHRIRVDYLEATANAEVHLYWRMPGEPGFSVIPADAYRSQERYLDKND